MKVSTSFLTRCPACGNVKVPASEVTLLADLSGYYYMCPSCHNRVDKKATEGIVTLLRSGQVREESLLPPASSAPGFVYDDLISFHEGLDAELEELLGDETL